MRQVVCLPGFCVFFCEHCVMSVFKQMGWLAPSGSPAGQVVSPTALTGKPASFAEPRRAAFRA